MGVYKLSTAGGLTTPRTNYFSFLAGNPAFAPNSYESIATVTVGSGGQANVEFTSIPSTYKHLQIRFIAQTNRGTFGTDNILIRVGNGSIDTGSNYSSHGRVGDGASVTTYGIANTSQFGAQGSASGASNIYAAGIMDVLEYANTNTNKTARILSGVDHNGLIASYGGQIIFSSGQWRNTTAVTTIQFRPEFGSGFTEHSQFALYGMKA
jgi:hypothetical protein